MIQENHQVSVRLIPPNASFSQPKQFASYEETLKEIQNLDPTAILQNISIEYARPKNSSEGILSLEHINFTYSEMTVEKFQEALECCNPKHRFSAHTVQKCWREAFPGSTSSVWLNFPNREQ
ncbi:MAG: hypothetical protein Q8L98_05415 [Chlamydiales bacterium]|nr:hypothetical protein [Chlamydiales bacterium]